MPNGFLRCDAAFVKNPKNCSNGSLDIVIIESNKFMAFNADIKEWKSPQSLNSNQMFSDIIAHMNGSIQINAITDWEQNYFIIEWMSTCDAINGIGIKTYLLVDTDLKTDLLIHHFCWQFRKKSKTQAIFYICLAIDIISQWLSSDLTQQTDKLYETSNLLKKLKIFSYVFQQIQLLWSLNL